MSKKESSIKKVILNSGIYSFTSILQKGIGFLLLPLYTIYLTPDDYGITGIINSFTSILTILFTLSLNGAIQRYYYVYKDDEKQQKSFFGTVIIFVLLNSVFLSAILIFFQKWLISPFIDGVDFYPYIFIGILTVFFNPIYTIYQSLLQTMQKGKEYGKNSFLHFGVTIALNILLIIIFELGALGQLLSYLFTALVFGIFAVFSLYKNEIISLDFNFKYLKEALNYSVPLLPHTLSSSIASFISRLLLNNQVSTASAGLFNISSQFMIIIETLQNSVNQAYIPWFYDEMENDDNRGKENIIDFSDIFSRMYLIISVAISFVIKEVIQLFLPDSYLMSWVLIPIMLVAYQFKTIYLFYVNTLFYNTKSTKFIFIASVTGSIVNILVASSLTNKIGLMAPAIAVLVQWIVTSGIVIILSRIIEPVNFKLDRMIGYIFIMIVVIAIGQFFDFKNPTSEITLFNIVYKIVIFLVFFIIIIYKDLPIIKEMITKIVEKIRK